MFTRMRQPWMSVIVPAYNEEQAIAGTLVALRERLAESGRPYEILVVDNASTDRTVERAEAVGSRLAPGADVGKHQPFRRRLVGWPFIALTRLLMAEPTRDVYCGFKLWRGVAAQAVFSRQRLDGWVYDAESLAMARRLGYRVREVGIVWVNREASKLSIARTLAPAVRELLLARRNVRVQARAHGPVDGRGAAGGAVGRRQLRAGRRGHGLPPVLPARPRRPAGRAALEPARDGWPAVPRKRPVGGLLALHLAGVRAAVLEVPRRDGAPQALRRRARDIRAGPSAGHALRRRPPGRPGPRLRHLLRRLAGLAAHEHLPAAAVAPAPHRADRPPPGGAAGRRARGARDAGVLRRPPRDELPRAGRHSCVLRLSRAACVEALRP